MDLSDLIESNHSRASARIAAKVELSSDEDEAAARRKSYAAARAAGAPKKGIIGRFSD